MKSLIIGKGEVGKSLYRVLKNSHSTSIKDKPIPGSHEKGKKVKYEIIHICFPYFKGFEKEVRKYQKEYGPKYTIIHSTVPIGTSRKCRSFHSPIRGTHPNLTKSIRTFVKYLGPNSQEVKIYFERAGIKIKMLDKSETTELLKILSTTYYAWNIIFCKEVNKICKKYNLDINQVYTEPNKTYNQGYKKLARANVIRPILKPTFGQIGGHCLIQNCKLLKSEITRVILKFNKKY